MRKVYYCYTLLFLVSASISAKAAEPPKKSDSKIYGVCSCSDKSNSSIKLSLKEDHSFEYIDNTIPGKNLRLTGTWVEKAEKIVLNPTEKTNPFHKTWKSSKSGKCIKSRLKFNFRRICLMEEC